MLEKVMIHFKRIFRWALAVLLLLTSYALFRFGVTLSLGPGAFVVLVAMFFCILMASALLLPESLPIVTRPFTALIDGVYGTGPGRGRPPFDCSLARGYRKQRRSEDALCEYRRIMKYYPREAEPYRESVVILLSEFGDRDAATRVLHRGLRKIRAKDEHAALKAVFEEELGRLDADTPEIF